MNYPVLFGTIAGVITLICRKHKEKEFQQNQENQMEKPDYDGYTQDDKDETQNRNNQ